MTENLNITEELELEEKTSELRHLLTLWPETLDSVDVARIAELREMLGERIVGYVENVIRQYGMEVLA